LIVTFQIDPPRLPLITPHSSPITFFLTATADPTRTGILSDHRESKELSCGNLEILQAAEAAEILTATFDLQDFA
jgi:hypothetical protein